MLLLFGGCTVQSLRDPCFFDPPPGDQLTLAVANDTTKTVTVVDCREEACSTANKPTTIAAGASGDMPLEGCQGGTMGVLEVTSHRLTACIAEPTEDLQLQLPPVAVSKAKTCQPGHSGQHVRVLGSDG